MIKLPKRYAIGDVHGCSRTLNALLHKLALAPEDELYFLGDYVDRGPDSKGVLDTIIDLRESGQKVICIQGNHEYRMLKARRDKHKYSEWLMKWGGMETLDSFNVSHINDIDSKYWRFLSNLPYVHTVDNFIMVHAGLKFRAFSPLLKTRDMLFIRNWYSDINYRWLKNRIIIHGHTPIPYSKIQKLTNDSESKQVINLDNGCFYGNNDLDGNLGRLCALDIDSRTLFYQDNIESLGMSVSLVG